MLDQDGSGVRPVLAQSGVNVNTLHVGLDRALDSMPTVQGAGGQVHVSNELSRLELVFPSMFHAGQGAAPLRVGRTTGTACTVDRSFEETFRACHGMESVHARCPRCGVRCAFDRSGCVNAVPKRSP